MAKLYLKKNEDIRIKSGHPWVFSNEIRNIEGEAENGDIVEAYDSHGKFLGSGFFNGNSLISLRLLDNCFEGNFHAYAKNHLHRAVGLRKLFYPHRDSYRMCFSESDSMPGLIIDKYNSTFVLQVYSFGIERNIGDIVRVLTEDFEARNIFTLHEPHLRKIEGLPEEDTVFLGSQTEEMIDDGKVKYIIDFKSSQKTGFYFDQCDNREFAGRFSFGKKVLDAFCNCGGFGLHAAIGGAGSVDFVDSSRIEIENARNNFRLNSALYKGIVGGFISEDVFDFMQKAFDFDKKYNIIILDPPAFAKNKKNVATALKGYEKLNMLAIRLLEKDGVLITSSCSHHVSQQNFLDAVNKAGVKANRKIQLIYLNGASLDHPRLLAMPESSYLKFAVFHVN